MGRDAKRAFWAGGLTTSGAAVAGGFKLAFPDMIVPFEWAMALVAVGLASMAVCALFGLRALFGLDDRFDDVRAWSVSVHPGMPAVAARNGNLDRFLLQMCQFANLSKDQARIIELTVLIPFYDVSKEPVKLVKTRTDQLPYEDVWADSNPRYQANLLFPITIAPNTMVEGRVEFEVPAGIKVSEIDWSSPVIKIVESRGAQSITVLPNHVYDAGKGKQYRGLLGAPFPRKAQRDLRRLKAATAHISRE
jgi:hypothetical protein